MRRQIAAALVMVGTLAASVSAAGASTIGIDFGCGENVTGSSNCVTGDAPLQADYLAWSGPHLEVPLNYNETRSFSADFGVGGSFNLNVTSDALYFRDYPALTGGAHTGQSDLLSDNINRNSAGSIEFTFSGLIAGEYNLQSFHHDSAFGSSTVPFDIIIDDVLGTRTAVSGADTSGGTTPASITALLYTLTVGTDGMATVTFSTKSADAAEHMSINGFQLTGPAPIPLPAGGWLLLTALGGLGLAGWRRKRMAA